MTNSAASISSVSPELSLEAVAIARRWRLPKGSVAARNRAETRPA